MLRPLFTAPAAIIARIAIPLLPGACGTDAAPSNDERAAATAQTIELDEAALQQLPEWRLAPDPLVIGTREGAAPYLLNRTTMPAVLSTGTIVVPNNRSELRWYDSRGAYRRTVGRRGQGPGDFAQLWNAHAVEGDTLLVVDGGQRRVSVLDSAGRFVRAHQLPPMSFPTGASWLDDRTMVFLHRPARALPDSGVVLDSLLLIRSGLAGEPYDTIATVKGYWTYYPRPRTAQGHRFAGDPLLAAGADRIAVGHGDEFRLQWFDRSGTPTGAIRVAVARIPVPASMIEAYAAEAEYERGRIEASGQIPPPRERLVHADSLPAITRLFVDGTGQTWMRRGVADGATEAPWVLFARDGSALARLTMPARFSPAWADGERVVGRFIDDDGVESIRRYRLLH